MDARAKCETTELIFQKGINFIIEPNFLMNCSALSYSKACTLLEGHRSLPMGPNDAISTNNKVMKVLKSAFSLTTREFAVLLERSN